MKFIRQFSLSLLLVAGYPSAATNINAITANNIDNIFVKKIADDTKATSFVIFIKKHVKPHLHKTHTELLYVLEGSADMQLGEQHISLTPGTFVQIPEGTVHAVTVTSDTPLKVLSIQTPQFHGQDRHFVTPQ